jgi:signal transduction histidine kinase
MSRRQCYALAATGSGLFTLLGLGEWSGILEHHTLLLSPQFEPGGRLVHLAHYPVYVMGSASLLAVVLFLAASFVTTLAERMRSDERRLEVLADRALASQQLLEQALETTGTGLRVVDGNLQTQWANRLWRTWFETPPDPGVPGPEPLVGRANSPASLSLKDGRSRVTELAPDSPPQGGPERPRPAVHARTFKVTTAPLRDATGRVQQIAQLAEDVTGHHQFQARMVRAERLAALGQLAGQVAHEVNNPIGIISGKVWVLLSDHRPEMTAVIADELEKIREAADRVARIASGLLSYSRPSRGERARLDLRLPIRRSLTLIEEPARGRGVQIRDLLPGELPPIQGNASEMEQVFLNLFLNALDAMPDGGCLSVSAQIQAEPRDQAPRVAIVVEDTGVGIAPGIRERLFEPFFTTKQEGRGTGLGLGICLGLVRGHQGEIEVESEPGLGTRFIVTLPIATGSSPAEEPTHA